MTDALIIAVEISCAAVILAAAIYQLNHMTAATPHVWRAAHCALACGATGLMLQPVWPPHPPTMSELMLLIGFAASYIADRREKREPWHHDDRQVTG